MTYGQAYIEGFCKTAEAAGVDPVALCRVSAAGGMAKRATGPDLSRLWGSLVGSGNNPGIVTRLLANEHLRRALVSALIGGTTAAFTSSPGNRMRNALIAAGLTGLGTYGASAYGLLDNSLSPSTASAGAQRRFNDAARQDTAAGMSHAMHGPGGFMDRARGVIGSTAAGWRNGAM